MKVIVDNGIQQNLDFRLFKFSGGEQHIWFDSTTIPSDISYVYIKVKIRSLDDLISAAMAKDALERMNINCPFYLYMYYIPYARQDRVCDKGESFSLKVFTSLLNSIGFDRIYVFDPHSDVSTALINNCIIMNEEYFKFVHKAFNEIKNSITCESPITYEKQELWLVCPDAGAEKKTYKIADYIGIEYDDIVFCSKKRNVSSGNITDTIIYKNKEKLKNKNFFIVDDICDGGKTFIEIAKKLREAKANNIYLYVSHGIFSKGIDELLKYFHHIFTTNSFQDIYNNSNITQYKLY